MANSPDETYIQAYQKHLKHQKSYDNLHKAISDETAPTKVLKPNSSSEIECRICAILEKPEDLYLTLNQGLYYKYTSSQDYYYSRDINGLLLNKRRAFTVRYHDLEVFDECKERLKEFYPRSESRCLLKEIKAFYVQFKNFPKNFHLRFTKIMDSNIRKHRRLEYNRVFNDMEIQEEELAEEQVQDPKDNSIDKKDNYRFNFMEMLSDSFLQDNYRDVSGVVVGSMKLDRRRNTERLMKEMDRNFRALCKAQEKEVPVKKDQPPADPFSNALYNNDFMLYSRSDSETAEDMLKQILHGFKEPDFNRKPSMTLAEKVLQLQTNLVDKIPTKKIENKYKPSLLKSRPNSGNTGNGISPVIASQKSPMTLNSFNHVINLQQFKKQSPPHLTTLIRGASNPRANSNSRGRGETGGVKLVNKTNENKSFEQKAVSSNKPKYFMENLVDLALNKDKLLSKVENFRSTRNKSGNLKVSTMLDKSSSNKYNNNKVMTEANLETYASDIFEGKKIYTEYFVDGRSLSPSPERLSSREGKPATPIEFLMPKLQNNCDSPQSNKLTRNASEKNSVNIPIATKPSHKKSQSSIKRTSTAARKNHQTNPSINLVVSTHNSSNSNITSSQANLDNYQIYPNMKFSSNPRQVTPEKTTHKYYLVHPPPTEEKMLLDSKTPSHLLKQSLRGLNIKGIQDLMAKKREAAKGGVTSNSGRHQMSELTHIMSSSMGFSQNSLHLNKTKPEISQQKTLIKTEVHQSMQSLAFKSPTRNYASTKQLIVPREDVGNSKKKEVVKKKSGLSGTRQSSYKDLSLLSKEQAYSSNQLTTAVTVTNKRRVEPKVTLESFSVKGNRKSVKFPFKKL